MPAGGFFSDFNRDSGGGGMTGSGPASQPKNTLASQVPMGGGGSPYPIGPAAHAPRPLNAYDATPAGQANIKLYHQVQQSPYAAMVNSYYGPQAQLLADQLGNQQAQVGLINLGVDQQSAALKRDSALAMQALGLDKQALGVDKNLNSTQLANLSKLKAILGKQYGLEGEQFANQLGGLKIDETSLRDNAKRSQWDLRSNLTARGAFNTVANERGTGRINRDLIYGLGKINSQRTAADIAHRGNILGLDEKGIGYANTQAGLEANLAKLGLNSQQLGITGQQIANKLQDGLDAIGLGGLMSVGEMMAAMSGTNTQSAQFLTTVYNQIAAMQGLPPIAMPGGGAKKPPGGLKVAM